MANQIISEKFSNKLQESLFLDFKNRGFPTRKTERWKFTPVSRWFEQEIPLDASPQIRTEGKGHEVEDLGTEGLQEYKNLLEKHGLWEDDDQLFKLHLSQISKVFKISHSGDEALHIHHSSNGGFQNYALIIDCKKSANIIEYFTSTKGFHQSSRVLIINDKITVKHSFIQGSGQEETSQQWLKVALEKESDYRNFIFNLGSGQARINPLIKINAENSHAECHAHYFLSKDEHLDIFSKIIHLAPNTTSDQVVKGLLHDKSKTGFTGNIYIGKNCPGVEAAQFSKNLVMEKGAQAFSQPQLEIFSDDVKCAHGSTTGQVDTEEIFYLTSRGISPVHAKKLITESYGKEILEKMEDQELEKIVEAFLTKKTKGFYE